MESCPFCGGMKIRATAAKTRDQQVHAECGNCGALGPASQIDPLWGEGRNAKSDAVRLWNERREAETV